MVNRGMMFRFALICLLLRYGNCAEDQLLRIRREINEDRYCNFDDTRNNYNATDLLLCIDELAVDLVARESGELINAKGQQNGSTGRQHSFMEIFSNIFSNAVTSPQSNPHPTGSTSVYQQSNYPAGTVAFSPGFQLNLLDALSTISRHDDYKCVPRILCEMASGKLPGRSLGKQGSGFFEFLGRNVFTDWLTKIDVAGASPLLNFGRAMILGYSNRGNSRACYEAFPKCPRDMNGLIYYLNNYNGGFFRLFNRYHGGKYRKYGGVPSQRVGDHSKTDVRERIVSRIVSGNSKGFIRNGPVRANIQFPFAKYQQYSDENEFVKYDETKTGNEIVFPDEKQLNDKPVAYSLQNDIAKSELNIRQEESIGFFPREGDGRKLSHFRFPSSSFHH